jgi:E74-like factor 1/2/4
MLGSTSSMSLAMPFIDNDLLWCPDNDGKMVDLSACLQDAASVAVGQQNTATGGLGELSQSDLSSLVPPMPEEQTHMGDNDDIFKHLTDPSFELDNLLNEFNTHDIKQEENNNSVNSVDHSVSSSSLRNNLKYTIAAANPLLAEKLATPTNSHLNNVHSIGNSLHHDATSATQPQLATLTPKIEKGKQCNFIYLN